MPTEAPSPAFPPSDKGDWLEQAQRELKGDVSRLDEDVTERIRLSALYTADEVEARPALDREAGWEIGAYLRSGTNRAINEAARTALNQGAEALLYRLYHQPTPAEIADLLAGIRLDYISVHCALRYPGQDPAELFRDLIKYLRREGYRLGDIRGSVDFDPLLDWNEPPFPPLLRLLDFVGEYMPGFKVLQVNAAGFNNGPGSADSELALAIAKGAEYLQQIRARDYPVEVAARHLQFAFTVGNSYYVDVAKLRALRILWANVLRGFGIENARPVTIAAHTDLATLTPDRDQNLLLLTTQGLSAVTGGADQVFLSPAEGPEEKSTDFGHRMALNVQHLLRLEAGLDAYADPAAGSYYLETLTEQLVESAWERFKAVEAQGGFAEATDF